MKLKIVGLINAKFAAHVPVIRNWRIVWERREFGTKRIWLSETATLPFDAYTDLKNHPAVVELGPLRATIKQAARFPYIIASVEMMSGPVPIPLFSELIKLPVGVHIASQSVGVEFNRNGVTGHARLTLES
jgi:hypothetical protein